MADRLDALLNVMHDEGVEDLIVSVATVQAYQARLASDGFNATEIEAAHTIGLTDAELEAIRQARLVADPAELAGSVVTRLRAVADSLCPLGEVLMDPPNFDEGDAGRVPGSSAVGTNLARIFAVHASF